MKVAYADPPYPGQSAKHYADHPDYAGEVDHGELVERLSWYDGWALSTSTTALPYVLNQMPDWLLPDPWISTPGRVRIMAWVKPFAAYKRNIKVAYSWEPVLVRAARKPEPNRIDGITLRDYIAEPITLRRGVVGVKPERFCWWLFEVLGMRPDDELDDLFPGSGAVTEAWKAWRRAPQFEAVS